MSCSIFSMQSMVIPELKKAKSLCYIIFITISIRLQLLLLPLPLYPILIIFIKNHISSDPRPSQITTIEMIEGDLTKVNSCFHGTLLSTLSKREIRLSL